MAESSPLDRRHAACGSELEHTAHPYTQDLWPDGRVLGDRDKPGMCAGWTAQEADLCAMLREVARVMAEKAPPEFPAGRFRLEVSPGVASGLFGLFLTPAQVVSRAEIVIIPGLRAYGWQLVEVPPALAAGTVR